MHFQINVRSAVRIGLLSVILYAAGSFNACTKLEPVRIMKVETRTVADLDYSTATAQGRIIDIGEGRAVYGFCYSEKQNPNIESGILVGSVETLQTTGDYTGLISDLTPGTTYYIKAYIKNDGEPIYGDQSSFTTLQPDRPVVSTADTSEVTENTVQIGGMVESDGGSPVTSRGVCWSAVANPSTADSKTQDGSGTGSFSSTISELEPNTVYYVRAYAINEVGTSYGNQVSFRTDLSRLLPTLSTAAVSEIGINTATSGGTVINIGGSAVIESGICWSTESGPTIADVHTTDGSGTGSFISYMTGLSPSTKYYVRAYAVNSSGPAYGNEVSFTTLPESNSVTDYDGNEYPIIKVGNQTWMAENLRVTHYADGTPIQRVQGTVAWDDLTATSKAYCYFDNDPLNGQEYGALYHWAGVMNGESPSDANPSGVQGVCPAGWHVPSDAEWKELEIYLGMSSAEADGTDWRGTDQGGKLKESGYDHWDSPNSGANNASGLTILPGGLRHLEGAFQDLIRKGYYWTASEESSSRTWSRHFSWDNAKVYRYNSIKNYGFSVRCVRDE